MKTLITIGLLLASQLAFSQRNSLDSLLSMEIGRLMKAKNQYEMFKARAGKGTEGRYTHSRDSSYRAYLAQIRKIKKSSAQYINYIDRELQNLELDKKLFFYSYPNPIMSVFDRNEYMISKWDFYRAIKYLLERDARALPETLDDFPFPIKRDHYRPFKLQTEKDFFTEVPKY